MRTLKTDSTSSSKVLIEAGANKSKAAEILGLDRKTLYRKLEEMYDLV